jgi:glycosyltransferase involved in cell wall biosynthesis
MKILLVTDAWRPQLNGVVRTLEHLRDELTPLGHQMEVIHPGLFHSVPCPTYPEIRLSWNAAWAMGRRIRELRPDSVHLATEGPLGMAARRWCMRHRVPFTTAFHTRFPEYINERWGVPTAWGYRWMRRFHAPAVRTMVATPSLRDDLASRGFEHLVYWTRGVDIRLFRPRPQRTLELPRPVFLNVGRIAPEKNLEAFLALDLPGSKLVVGDGPDRARLQARHPEVHFVGAKEGEELAECFTSADAFVFPSRTDTFGLVLLEAMASGLPVAAFPVTGPRDVVLQGVTGCLGEDLRAAALAALELSPAECRRHAEAYSWEASARQFLSQVAASGGAAQVPEAAPGQA